MKDPLTVSRERDLRIERALPAALWDAVRAHAQQQAGVDDAQPAARSTAARWRIARALMLLMGDSGLRREEVAGARREALRPSPHATPDQPVWQLTIIGKRNKERTVPVSPDTIDALVAHWRDRGEDFDGAERGPLLSPLAIPATPQAQKKHAAEEPQPYSVNVLNDLIDWMRARLVAQLDLPDPAMLAVLSALSPHAFRHTFGTQAVAEDVPLDVVQKILGHASLQTTSIYVQAEQQRMMREASRFYTKKTVDTGD